MNNSSPRPRSRHLHTDCCLHTNYNMAPTQELSPAPHSGSPWDRAPAEPSERVIVLQPIVICTVSHYFAQIHTFTTQLCFIHSLSFWVSTTIALKQRCTCLNMQIIYEWQIYLISTKQKIVCLNVSPTQFFLSGSENKCMKLICSVASAVTCWLLIACITLCGKSK